MPPIPFAKLIERERVAAYNQSSKRRLIKGPKEFRDLRGNRSKRK